MLGASVPLTPTLQQFVILPVIYVSCLFIHKSLICYNLFESNIVTLKCKAIE